MAICGPEGADREGRLRRRSPLGYPLGCAGRAAGSSGLRHLDRMNLRRSCCGVAALLLAATLAAAQSLPTPEQYLGFRVGTDRRLATWGQVLDYLQTLARGSERLRYVELGKSTLGHPFALVTISSPHNLARLEEIRARQRQLAYPYALEEAAARQIIARQPVVVLITLTIHATEVGATQMALELVHRLATEESPYVRNLLDNVVLLLVPSANPDGQELVASWYNKNVGTEFEYAPLPWLYHPYTGHDNNRDAFMLTQVETRYVTKILYQDWFPLVFLDEHQMASAGPRAFVPPFADPVNPNLDPAVLAAANSLGMHMFNALHQAGYPGVLYGERYTWWWQGSAKNGAWYHNIVGLLSEVASARLASPVEQQRGELYRMAREAAGPEAAPPGDPRRPLPPPTDTWPRTNYPQPWLGGTWRLRDIIDYELVATFALLEAAALHRAELLSNFHALNRKAIEKGEQGHPFAYLIPPDQHDPGAAWKLLEALHYAGVEVERADAPFQADGKEYPAGTYIVPLAQPFRNYAKDLLEPQNYPMKPARPGELPERPYDVTGWTLPLQMGVRAIRIDKPFPRTRSPLAAIPPPQGELLVGADGAPSGFLIAPGPNNKVRLTNRLLKAGAEVYWVTQAVRSRARGARYPAGSLYVRKISAAELQPLVVALGLQGESWPADEEAALRAKLLRLRAPRVGLYQSWTANMDEGWTRWLLEQFEFPYTSLHNADLRAGRLAEAFDVIIFPSQSKGSILEGARGPWQRPEYRGGLGDAGTRAVQAFVRAGGTLVTLDDAADFAIDELKLPVRNVLRNVPPDRFYCPGAILKILVDPDHPVAYGLPAQSSAYFLNSPAFELAPAAREGVARAVAKYPSANPLQSGWIGGPEQLRDRVAVAEVSYGKGRVVLLGFRAQFRAQAHATFPLLFNALHWSAAAR